MLETYFIFIDNVDSEYHLKLLIIQKLSIKSIKTVLNFEEYPVKYLSIKAFGYIDFMN